MKQIDVKKAKELGFTEAQIRQLLKENPEVLSPGFAAKAEPAGGGLLGALLNPVARFGKNVAGGVFEASRAGATALAPYLGMKDKQYNLYVDPKTGKAIENPFLSQQELSAYDTGKTGVENIMRQAATEDSGLRQGVKDTLNTASYAVPFGKGASLLSKVLAPGATVGAMQGLSEDTVTPMGVAAQTAGGALGAGLLHGAGKAGAKVGSYLTKGGERLAEKAGATFLKSSPAVFEKAADAGININKAFNKYFKAGDDVNAIIGSVENPGGKLQTLLNENERIINQTIKNAGNDVIATADDLIKPLTEQMAKLASVPGNQAKVQNLASFIEEVRQLYPEGLTAQKLLDVKRLFDKQFGASVVDDATGAVIRDSQKSIANTAREKLKSTFTTIKNALDNESELLTLEPVLNRARAGAETTLLKQPGGLGLLDFLTGATALGLSGGNSLAAVGAVGAKKALQSPAVISGIGSTMKALGGSSLPTNQVVTNIAGQGASRMGSAAGGALQQSVSPTEQQTIAPGNDQNQPTDQVAPPKPTYDYSKLSPEQQKAMQIIDQAEQQATASKGGASTLTGYTPEQLGQAYMMAVVSGDTKAATQLKGMYELETSYKEKQAVKEKPLAAVTENRVQLANSGLRALNELEKIYEKDPSKIIKAAIPGQLGARDYDSAAFRAVEGLLRARSGAAIPETEVRRYMNANLPRFGDTPEDVKFKMDAFRRDLEDVANSGKSTNDTELILQNLKELGVTL